MHINSNFYSGFSKIIYSLNVVYPLSLFKNVFPFFCYHKYTFKKMANCFWGIYYQNIVIEKVIPHLPQEI